MGEIELIFKGLICPKCKSPYWNKPRKNKKDEKKR